jgi:hypothetical protein
MVCKILLSHTLTPPQVPGENTEHPERKTQNTLWILWLR